MTCRTILLLFFFFFSSRRRHTRCSRDWSSDVCAFTTDAVNEAESPTLITKAEKFVMMAVGGPARSAVGSDLQLPAATARTATPIASTVTRRFMRASLDGLDAQNRCTSSPASAP